MIRRPIIFVGQTNDLFSSFILARLVQYRIFMSWLRAAKHKGAFINYFHLKLQRSHLKGNIFFNLRIKPSENKGIPKIPSQPIGYDDAKKFLEKMAGPASPTSWRGKIQGVEYRLGGEMLVNQ